MFNDKSILITGGTGSFGKAFVNHLLNQYYPKRVIVYSRDELKQSEMAQELNADCMRYFLGDVRDLPRLTLAMQDVDYVVHAAALKQIPAAEYNPMECIKTNINGAQNVITAALKSNVEKVIGLSTDKAVNPINLYGATKLAADKLFIAANNIAGANRTRFSVVRYGNVIGSRGSVMPVFKSMIEKGVKELPVTHEQMTRFWITLSHGVEFVVKNFARMHGGEIFIPKLPTALVTDIAKAMAPNLPIKTIGIRPGEKLHEVMCPRDDAHSTIEFSDHFIVEPVLSFARDISYLKNEVGERGKRVPENFEYESGSNTEILSVDQLREYSEML